MPKLNWKHNPTDAEIKEGLKDIPAWPGASKTLGNDYREYVVTIKSKTGGVEVWTPYVTVDGRIRMFMDAHIEAGKTYEERIFAPNILNVNEKSLQKFIVIGISIDSELWGRREDIATALADIDDYRKVDSTNPYENGTTSARGRVIAAFGVGIIPCMGIASYEEVSNAMSRREQSTSDGVVEPKTIPKKKTSSQEYINEESYPVKNDDPFVDDAPIEEDEQKPKKKEINPNILKNFNEALTIAKCTEEELVAAHIEDAKARNVTLSSDWSSWTVVEIVKMKNTAKKIATGNG